MTVSVCIPMYNERDTAENCVRQLSDKMRELSAEHGYGYEIIFCDDGSTDGCGKIAGECAAGDPHVRIIGYEKNRGKGAAVREAILACRGDAVLYTDCDLAYGVDVIEDAVKNIVSDGGDFRYDVVIGSRNLAKDGYGGYGFVRKLASKTYIKMLALIGGFSLTDSQCGFKIFKAQSAKKIFSLCECDGFAFDYEAVLIAKKLGMKVTEMPVKIVNHRDSTVRVGRDSLSMLKDVFKIKKRVKKIGT